jgi:hypothetical protein
MAKAKKQLRKAKSTIKKIVFDETHSLTNHDADSKKHLKKDAKKARRAAEAKISIPEKSPTKLKKKKKKSQ